MLEKKILIKAEKILCNEDVFMNFNNILVKNNHVLWRNIELFELAGDIFNPISFDFNVRGEYSNTKICKVDDIQFVTDALKITKEHRVIDDKVYKKLEESISGKIGTYVLALNNEPYLDINILPNEDYIHNLMIFQPYGKKEFFKHKPIIPKQVEMSFFVTNQKKQRDFIKMYERILKNYLDKNAEIVEPESENV